jgi:4-oxalocrotonate tautomerase
MPLVRIDLWAGQSQDCKDALMRDVTRVVVEAVGCPPEAVEIVIYETAKANWSSGGVSHAQKFANWKRPLNP